MAIASYANASNAPLAPNSSSAKSTFIAAATPANSAATTPTPTTIAPPQTSPKGQFMINASQFAPPTSSPSPTTSTPPPSSNPTQPAPAPAAPAAPVADPNQGYKDAMTAYIKSLSPSQDYTDTQTKLDNLISSTQSGVNAQEKAPIPLEFITGRQRAIQKEGIDLAQPLNQKLNRLQNVQTATTDAAKANVDFQKSLIPTPTDNKPFAVGDKTYQLNPKTKAYEAIDTKAPSITEKYGSGSIGEYNFAKSQGYTGSFEQYQNEDANRKAKATAAAGGTGNSAQDIEDWAQAVQNGNSTIAQVPIALRTQVAHALNTASGPDGEGGTYSPLAASRETMAASRIVSNFIQLPQYELTANGLPYLQRIDAAMKTPGSVSDQDLLDSLTKLNTAGNAITDAQVRIITDGKSLSDIASTFANKLGNGGVLSENQRNQIQSIAKAIYSNYKKGYQPVYDQVAAQLKAAGIPKQFWTLPDLNNLSAQAGEGGSTEEGGGTPTDFSDIQSNITIAPDGKTAYLPRSVWSTLGDRQDALLAEAQKDGYKLLIQ